MTEFALDRITILGTPAGSCICWAILECGAASFESSLPRPAAIAGRRRRSTSSRTGRAPSSSHAMSFTAGVRLIKSFDFENSGVDMYSCYVSQ